MHTKVYISHFRQKAHGRDTQIMHIPRCADNKTNTGTDIKLRGTYIKQKTIRDTETKHIDTDTRHIDTGGINTLIPILLIQNYRYCTQKYK